MPYNELLKTQSAHFLLEIQAGVIDGVDNSPFAVQVEYHSSF